MDEVLREKLLQIQKLESRIAYTLMDRINYPTQEFVVVGSDSKHQVLQTCPEVGMFGVLVRLVYKNMQPILTLSVVYNIVISYNYNMSQNLIDRWLYQ